MSLSYEIVTDWGPRHVRVTAKPNEWACNIHAEVHASWVDAKPELDISWSTGARNWTPEDAALFFEAGKQVLARLKAVQRSKRYQKLFGDAK